MEGKVVITGNTASGFEKRLAVFNETEGIDDYWTAGIIVNNADRKLIINLSELPKELAFIEIQFPAKL